MPDLTSPNDPDPAGDIPYRSILEQSLAGIYVLQDERFVYSNATFAGIAGYRPDELLGRHVTEFVQPDYVAEVMESYRRRMNGVPSERFVSRAKHKDGRLVLFDIDGRRTMYKGRPAMIGIGIEATERIRNEEELRRSRAQLQQLTAYTTAKLEEQRLTFARDVHDELGGMLTALKMDITRVMRRVDNDELRAMTLGLAALTQDTIDAVKRISEALRPSVLDHLELPLAIARDLDTFSERSGIAHAFDATGASTLRLPPKRTHAIYRIFHEALTNVARHAEAGHLRVALSIDGDRFVMQVEDDGRGFDAGAARDHSLGLLHMHERAREIGGTLHIDTSPGAGTRLRLSTPLL